jgi:GTPase SAR1 family protein
MGNVGLRKNKVGFLDYDLSKRIVNDAHLEENLQFFAEKEKEKLKLIFIGPHGSGKTTILRQLRQIHGDQYSEEELGQFLSVIHQNLINSMKILLEQCKRLGITGRVGPQKSLETITKYSGRTEFLPENIMFAIRLLWADPVIQSVWGMRAEYQINWTVQHFHDKCVSIAQPGYLPDNSDILRCDFPTAGITRELYDIEGSPFEIYDVGRHRGEKGRASQIYDNVSAIVFVADLTEYDQYKIDNGSRKNRLVRYDNQTSYLTV